MKKLSILIPAYNEEKTVAEVIRRVFAADTLDFEKEVIVVDDGSTDNTLSALKEISSFPFILISHPKNLGKGAAIRTALGRASGDAILIQDADLELDADDYPVLLKELNETTRVVYGSRNLLPRIDGKRYPLYSLGGKMLTGFFNFLYGTHLTDINTAYKLFSKETMRAEELKSDGFEFCEEITAKLTRKGYKIKEVPIRYTPRTFAGGKKLRAKDGLIGLWTIVKYRFFSDK
ncbi:MAG: glycosyltransferase family 2 protein [Candidatus Paceibacterota bacterium]|jgi:glycosyltransferase involved in cell wall biosynthesis